METGPLKSFATSARIELIREVTARITTVLAQGSPERVEQPRIVGALERVIATAGGGDKGKAHVADKVAYIWFNRIIALRFMDAHGYTGIGVVSPATDQVGQPEVLAAAKRGQVDRDVVSKDKNLATISGLLNGTREPRRGADAQAEAYALLLADYCRYWNKTMPFMFEREGDFTELLIPANLLADDSVLNRSVKVLTEDVCKDVEVIGWLYQFYISERKDEVFAGFKKNKKAGADEIPAATQLFTPHWIVRYLVENSLGRLWMLNRPTSRLVDQMDYYITPVDEETDFLKITKPEELNVIDPACGSGHMLTYAFDLLYAIYQEEGYAPSEIPGLILVNNLYGTEIDPRAGALAGFALTMKARAKQRSFFNKQAQPNVCVIVPTVFTPGELGYLSAVGVEQAAFWNQFENADTFGSLIQPGPDLTVKSASDLEALGQGDDIFTGDVIERAYQVVKQAKYLVRTYAVVVANPPYLSDKSFNESLKLLSRSQFSDTRSNLFGMFIDRAVRLLDPNGYAGLVTLHSWMSGAKYEKFRRRMVVSFPVQTLAHLGSGAFDAMGGQVVSTAAFVLKKGRNASFRGAFFDLTSQHGELAMGAMARELAADLSRQEVSLLSASAFLDLPGSTVAYRVTPRELVAFQDLDRLSDHADFRQGMATTDNERFLRRWSELSFSSIVFGSESAIGALARGGRWFPYNKGGGGRRWYGHNDFVVDYEENGQVLIDLVRQKYPRISDPEFVIKNRQYYFRPSVTYSALSGGAFSARICGSGFIFDTKGSSVFPRAGLELESLASLLNSSVASRFLDLLAPTLDYGLFALEGIPTPKVFPVGAESAVAEAVAISIDDWNSSELSWDFARPPILSERAPTHSFEESYLKTREDWRAAVARMKVLDEDNNTHLIRAYGLEDQVSAAVPISDVTLSCNPWYRYGREVSVESAEGNLLVDTVIDFVSYSVGCMFGRYSLDEPGLLLADQGATFHDYLAKVPSPTFTPDEDNVIPIVDGDWFEDDIVARFRQFLRAAFGGKHFEENLRFATESLGVKTLRDYFVKSFYKDHVQRYKKRPIYWLFSSPKGSFSALIYMHRYTPSTVSTVLTYLREYVTKLESSLQQAERAGNAKEADRLRKIIVELNEYEHDTLYPKASENIAIDLGDGVKVNYPKFDAALKKIVGLEPSNE